MKVKVGNEEIDLDPGVMNFSELTLNEFLTKDAGNYSYYHGKMVDAQYIASKYEDAYDNLYYTKFCEFKETGMAVATAEATAKCDKDVIEAQQKARITKRVKDQLWGFLKSLDKAHENALNLGYNVRKELNVLGTSTVNEKLDKLDKKKDHNDIIVD